MPTVPISEEDALIPVIVQLREMVDELSADMQQIQWRLAKLERQYGTDTTE
ncbi:MAG TPA: hypothetical protein VM639_05660 [Dongiaceae bacterium]|nr:hypothetical protein [Dongiaceae bacterium]